MIAERREGFFVGYVPDFEETSGYIIGSFMAEAGYPSLNFEELEVAFIQVPTKNESKPHYHEITTEVTYVLSGTLHLIIDQEEKIDLKENEFMVGKTGTILQNLSSEPGTKVMVIKFPSVPDDKYYV